jgi:hypothetical protein
MISSNSIGCRNCILHIYRFLVILFFSGCIQKNSFERLTNNHLDPEPYVLISGEDFVQ